MHALRRGNWWIEDRELKMSARPVVSSGSLGDLVATLGSFIAAGVATGVSWRLWSRRATHRDREAQLRRFGATVLAIGLVGVMITRLLGL
jgi:uncharacterized protein YjeT (DUF2065 family)